MTALYEQDIPEFIEFGDNSKVYIIALVDNTPVKIQVKARTPNRFGSMEVTLRSSGTNYHYMYTSEMVDLFAVVSLGIDKTVGFVPFSEWKHSEGKGKSLSLCVLEEAKHQKTKRFLKDYEDIRKSLNQ